MTSQKIRKTVKMLIEESEEDIDAVLLFGSEVTGETTSRSDIDICVVFKNPPTIREATLFRKRMLGKLPSNIDLQVFNTLPLKIKKQIADHHRTLYRSEEFDEFSFSRAQQAIFSEFKHRMSKIEA
ncbi:MAG: nucleotidyltransferase domain-containing protein [Candidatus Nanohaloarchaea archaeon]|nr:nucleotidyltransferase domain-containing protein [Candidatus Nanohaloarchaea archaeon]